MSMEYTEKLFVNKSSSRRINENVEKKLVRKIVENGEEEEEETMNYSTRKPRDSSREIYLFYSAAKVEEFSHKKRQRRSIDLITPSVFIITVT